MLIDEDPLLIGEDPLLVAEEPPLIDKDPLLIDEDPLLVTEELPLIDKDPLLIDEDPLLVAEEPPLLDEDPLLVDEELLPLDEGGMNGIDEEELPGVAPEVVLVTGAVEPKRLAAREEETLLDTEDVGNVPADVTIESAELVPVRKITAVEVELDVLLPRSTDAVDASMGGGYEP